MVSNQKKRLLFSCLYLGILFLVAGTVFHYLQHFSGTIFLLPGTSERLVFRPSDGRFHIGASQRSVAPELLLFDNSRSIQALRTDQYYDGIVLPFQLRLLEVQVLEEKPPRQVIQIDGPGGKLQVSVAPGTEVSVGGGTLTVESVGSWEGLVRVSGGEPMVALELPDAPTPLKFLESGRSYILKPDLAASFSWFANEEEARAALPTRLEDVAGARWGVLDRGSIQWFENFTPGTGLILEDGSRVVLAEAHRPEGYILLRIERGPGMETVRVMANAALPEDRYLYDDPAGTGQVISLHAWREDRIFARLLRRDGVQDFELKVGSRDAPVVPRQIMAQAVAVPGGKIRAAQVRLGEQSIALREGLAETVGDTRLMYREEPMMPEARYHVSALDPDGATIETFTIASGEQRRIGAWVLALSPENPFAPRGVALTAERRPGGLGQVVGLSLFVLGSFGLVVVRFASKP